MKRELTKSFPGEEKKRPQHDGAAGRCVGGMNRLRGDWPGDSLVGLLPTAPHCTDHLKKNIARAPAQI